jgi:predicted dehydrogenase
MIKKRWGIFGTGAIAEQFTQALKTIPNAEVNLVISRSLERARVFGSRFRIAHAECERDCDFQNAPVDVFYIATPNALHARHCMSLLTAGKPVLCEKPFALTAAEAEPVVALARQRRIFCMEAMWMRFSPALQEALRKARQGELGEIRSFCGDLGFAHDPNEDNRLFRQPGGGALLDLGVYPLSLVQALFGAPVDVKSFSILNSDGVDLAFSALLRYPRDTQAFVSASLVTQLTNSATLFGTEATLRLGPPLYFPETYRLAQTTRRSLKQGSHALRSQVLRLPGVRRLLEFQRRSRRSTSRRFSAKSGYAFQALEVHRCLEQGLIESPDMPLEDTLDVLRCADRIRDNWNM